MSFKIGLAGADRAGQPDYQGPGEIRFGQATPFIGPPPPAPIAPIPMAPPVPPLHAGTPARRALRRLTLPGLTPKQNFLASVLTTYSDPRSALSLGQLQTLLDYHRTEFPRVGRAYEVRTSARQAAINLVTRYPNYFSGAQVGTANGARYWRWWSTGILP